MFIKQSSITTLGAENKSIRKIASSLISHIAAIELPKGSWMEIVDLLYNNFTSQDLNVKLACIQTAGFICEEIIKVGKIDVVVQPVVRTNLVNVMAGSLQNENLDIIITTLKAIHNA